MDHQSSYFMAHPSTYFAAFVLLPDVIHGPGRYVTRSGETVTIETASKRHAFACRGRYADGIEEGWHKSGRLYFRMPCDNDVVARAA